jgi:hypothetical protein
MANQIYDLPPNLGDLMGAYDEAHWETFVAELKPASGVLKRGSVLSAVAADGGKLTLTTAGSEATAFGVLLDPSIDTAVAFSNNQVTGSVARSGSFKGQALIVGVGTNVVTLTDALRKNDIFVEGPITVPTAAMSEVMLQCHHERALLQSWRRNPR